MKNYYCFFIGVILSINAQLYSQNYLSDSVKYKSGSSITAVHDHSFISITYEKSVFNSIGSFYSARNKDYHMTLPSYVPGSGDVRFLKTVGWLALIGGVIGVSYDAKNKGLWSGIGITGIVLIILTN